MYGTNFKWVENNGVCPDITAYGEPGWFNVCKDAQTDTAVRVLPQEIQDSTTAFGSASAMDSGIPLFLARIGGKRAVWDMGDGCRQV